MGGERRSAGIHSLTRLYRESGLAADIPDGIPELLDVLEPMNIEARYPTQKDRLLKSLTHERCQDMYTRTKELYEWTSRTLANL